MRPEDLSAEDAELAQLTLLRIWHGRRRRAVFDATKRALAALKPTPAPDPAPLNPHPDVGPGGRPTRLCTCDDCHRRRAARGYTYTLRHRLSRAALPKSSEK